MKDSVSERDTLEKIVAFGGYSGLTAEEHARLVALRTEGARVYASVEPVEDLEDEDPEDALDEEDEDLEDALDEEDEDLEDEEDEEDEA